MKNRLIKIFFWLYFITIAALIIAVTCLIIFSIWRPTPIRTSFRNLASSSPLRLNVTATGTKILFKPLGVNDVGTIDSWMTFDYLNHIFNLPPAYLQNNLPITNTRYPHLTIRHYARLQQLDAAQFLSQVRAAVRTYLLTPQP